MTNDRMSWNTPEGRFFDVGLDRGVLYPRKPPVTSEVLATNLAVNPRGIKAAVDDVVIYTNQFKDPFFQGSDTSIFEGFNDTNTSFVVPADNGATFGTKVARGSKPPVAARTCTLWGGLVPNKPASARFRIRLTPGTTGVRSMSAMLYAYNSAKTSATAFSDATRNFILSTEWRDVEIKSSNLAPADAQHLGLSLYTESNSNAWVTDTDGYEIDAVSMDSIPSPPPFFSGDSIGTDEFDYSWEISLPYNSRSLAKAKKPMQWSSIFDATGSDLISINPDEGINFRSSSGVGLRLQLPGTKDAGKYYSASFKIRRLAGELAPDGFMLTPSIFAANVKVSEVVGWDGDLDDLPNDGSSLTVQVVSIAPSPASGPVVFRIQHSRYSPVNYTITDLQIEEVGGIGIPVENEFFDGDTESKKKSFEWVGQPQISPSTMRSVTSSAVPWNGLTSVDEEGGDGAASYYIDGRPFLYLPRPKEYKASLKAYTYPDAFSEIMGVAEIADGMYLDSQAGEVFDLSYRTLVGNGLDGVDHGYKLHLIYNATVAPQALTYESMSNSINPTTFSWEIQAVPVRVNGFRPTAHIIIDTRHMEQSKIDAIEDLLYGSSEELAHMPTPQVIFDVLSFGDTIIVTDNGDGTFDVTGSYDNVYMVSDGIFRVENVDGVNNGDGTFTISTTGE